LADITGLAALDWSLMQCKAHVGFMHYPQWLSGGLHKGFATCWLTAVMMLYYSQNRNIIHFPDENKAANCIWRAAYYSGSRLTGSKLIRTGYLPWGFSCSSCFSPDRFLYSPWSSPSKSLTTHHSWPHSLIILSYLTSTVETVSLHNRVMIY